MAGKYNAGGSLIRGYTMGLGLDQPLARIENSGAVHYYHADVLGSIVALTNSSGGVTTQYNYSPFGVTEVTGTDAVGLSQPFRFTGREWDAETGMYYYRARYYAPEMGRFISEDPIRFESGEVNWYAYVGNNPVNMIDPMGLYFASKEMKQFLENVSNECINRMKNKPKEDSICQSADVTSLVKSFCIFCCNELINNNPAAPIFFDDDWAMAICTDKCYDGVCKL